MQRNSRDQRVRRTCGAIVESFHRLAVRRPYDDIHVADIIGGAGVGRSTFYEHFRGKDELLRHSLAALLEPLANAVTGDGDRGRITFVLEHFRENRRPARALFNGPSASVVARHLADLMEARLAAACRQRNLAMIVPVRLAARQAAESQLALIRAWLDGIEPCGAGAAAEALCRTTDAASTLLARRARDGRG